MNRYERTNADVSPSVAGAGEPREGSESAESALTRLMSSLDPRSDNSTDTGRDEPQDDRPKLVAHDVSSVADGPLVAFYDPEGGATDGQILYARATISVGDWL